jgi:predicted nuclease of predicted toxin-antitoxin system
MTTQEAGMLGSSDDQQLTYAVDRERAIFTQDDDFLALAATNPNHVGIVYARQGTPIGDMVRGLMLITEIYTAEEMRGRVDFL